MTTDAKYFVGVGAQKCGTTWLAEYLSRHPQVLFSPIKELHFFDTENGVGGGIRRFTSRLAKYQARKRANEAKGIRPPLDPERQALLDALAERVAMSENPALYRDYFHRRLRPEHRVFGEITPSYSIPRPGIYEDILGMFPDAKFIFMMRNPVERYWSSLNCRFDDSEDVDVSKVAHRRLDEAHIDFRTNYKETITALSRLCPEDRVLYLFFENLFGPDGEQQVKRVTDFLGIDFVPPRLGEKQNEGTRRDPMPPYLRKAACERFAEIYAFAAERFPDELPERWRREMAGEAHAPVPARSRPAMLSRLVERLRYTALGRLYKKIRRGIRLHRRRGSGRRAWTR